jgi:hypothetical protein
LGREATFFAVSTHDNIIAITEDSMSDPIAEEKRVEHHQFCQAYFTIEVTGYGNAYDGNAMLSLLQSVTPRGNVIHLARVTNGAAYESNSVAMIAGRFHYSVETLMNNPNIMLVPSSNIKKQNSRFFTTIYIYSPVCEGTRSEVMGPLLDMMEVDTVITFNPPSGL